MYIPDGFIPDVETCRGASLPRNVFHTAGFTQYIYIPYIYYVYPPKPIIATPTLSTRNPQGCDP